MNAFKNIDRETALKLTAIIGILVLIFMIVFSMIEKSRELDGRLAKERRKLEEITLAAERYAMLSKSAPSAFKKASFVSLTSEVETMAKKAGIREDIEKISPKSGGKELTLSISGLQLYSFVNLLKSLKLSPSGIIIKRAVVKRSFEKSDELEVSLTLAKSF